MRREREEQRDREGIEREEAHVKTVEREKRRELKKLWRRRLE
jgi:hypothetical protein